MFGIELDLLAYYFSNEYADLLFPATERTYYMHTLTKSSAVGL